VPILLDVTVQTLLSLSPPLFLPGLSQAAFAMRVRKIIALATSAIAPFNVRAEGPAVLARSTTEPVAAYPLLVDVGYGVYNGVYNSTTGLNVWKGYCHKVKLRSIGAITLTKVSGYVSPPRPAAATDGSPPNHRESTGALCRLPPLARNARSHLHRYQRRALLRVMRTAYSSTSTLQFSARTNLFLS
jgi:hypothetical protein